MPSVSRAGDRAAGEAGDCPRAVLIVDDDRDVREAVREVLQDNGYDVLEAGNGQDALDMLRGNTRQPCVILLDIMMPVMDGRQFREAQCNDPSLAGIPVVVLSAGSHPQDGGEPPGPLDFLRKPVQLPPLLELVARYCDPS
jgi:CheY-like chemotaxis protein